MNKGSLSVYLAVLTAIAIAIVAGFGYVAGIQTAKDVSEILGGIGTAVALFWIVGGYIQQRTELNLQRDELSLQRQALQQQVEELKKAYSLSLKQEIAKMLSDAHSALTSAGGKLADFSQIGIAVMLSADWKIAFESTDPNQVMEASGKYFNTIGKVIIFMHTLATAAKMYFDAHSIRYTDNSEAAQFVYIHSPLLNDVYPFRNYLGPAVIAAEFLVSLEPGIKALKFAGLAAGVDLVSPDIIHIDKVLPDYLYLKERGSLPAIGRKVAHVFEDFIQNQARRPAA